MRWRATLFGAILGAAVGAAVPVGLAWRASLENPWFLDDPASFLRLAVLPLFFLGAAVGAWLGPRLGRGAPAMLVLAAALVGAELVAFDDASRAPTLQAPVAPQMLIIGLDGATWTLIDALKLPNIEALKARGASGVLRAQPPLFSPLLWTSIATGKSPELHGIHGFRVRADQRRAAALWDIAAFHGLSVGLYKWLVTWPPTPLAGGGFIVPCWLAAQPDTWPMELSFIKEIELSQRLKRRRIEGARPLWRLALAGVPHGLRWSTLRDGALFALSDKLGPVSGPQRSAYLQRLRVRMDRDVFIAQLHRHRPDLATFTMYSTDALGHTHWGYMTGGGRDQSDLPDAYRQADAIIGELLAEAGPKTTVVLLSDHGFRAIEYADQASHIAPKTERLRERLTPQLGAIEVNRVGARLILTLVDDPARIELESRLALVGPALDALTLGSTGAPFYRVEPVPGSLRAVGLVLTDESLPDDQLASDTVGGEPLADYVGRAEGYTGDHDPDGILVVAGPQVPAATALGTVSQLDVLPTALGLLGILAAHDMPGRALFGEAGTRIETYDALAPKKAADADEVQVNDEALRSLGYIE